MKANQTTIKKMGKRIYTLKELAQRDFGVLPKTLAEATTPNFSLVNIQEDLLEEESNNLIGKETTTKNTQEGTSREKRVQEKPKPPMANPNLALPIGILTRLIQKELTIVAQYLDLEVAELQAWIELQGLAPKQTLLALLRLAKGHMLDPLKEEVALALYEDCHWQAYITIEGYSKILNNHPAFDGISFSESEENINAIPIWMECTIYRKDRSQPTMVREYFEEVKSDQAIWQKMPRRMLRHRVMQQCARLAMG
jgi:hypothetical protein